MCSTFFKFFRCISQLLIESPNGKNGFNWNLKCRKPVTFNVRLLYVVITSNLPHFFSILLIQVTKLCWLLLSFRKKPCPHYNAKSSFPEWFNIKIEVWYLCKNYNANNKLSIEIQSTIRSKNQCYPTTPKEQTFRKTIIMLNWYNKCGER